jgi:hypothetical protein
VIRLEWFILAEGIGQDAKGALTLIGINQNALVTGALPVITKRALVAHIVDDADGLNEGDEVSATFKVSSPSGAVIAEPTTKLMVGLRRLKSLPAEIDIPAELGLEVKEYGTHKINVEVTIPGGVLPAKDLSLYVLDPSVLSAVEPGRADAGQEHDPTAEAQG